MATPPAAEVRPWPQDPRYTVSSDGTIYGVRGRPLRWQVVQDGYRALALRLASGRRLYTTVHRVVCETFHGPCPPGMEAAHLNGVATDCRATNLRWKTRANNYLDRLQHGTHGVKLTAEQVQEIRVSKLSDSILARKHGVTPLTIRHVRTGRTWRNLPWPDSQRSA